MMFAHFPTYALACEFAAKVEACGAKTAVLLSGEVRYWYPTPAEYTKIA